MARLGCARLVIARCRRRREAGILVQLARKDMREHRQPHAAGAFNALTVWRTRMASRRVPDRQQVSEAGLPSARDVRQQVLAVARVVGLGTPNYV
jgi:hypothetical protein